MATDYAKLTKDLIQARLAGEEYAKGEDGGTANLDTMTLKLPLVDKLTQETEQLKLCQRL